MSEVIGEKFGRLTIVAKTDRTNTQGQPIFACSCECGGATETTLGHLKTGHTNSCGCFRRERTKAVVTKHGKSKTKLYQVWSSMRRRCSEPSNADYANYGGRGIKVCERWQDFSTFAEDIGPRPSPKHSIDRIDVNGDYEPSNTRWVEQITQVINRRVKSPHGTGVQRYQRDGYVVFTARIGGSYLGSFQTAEEAAAAYLSAATEQHGVGFDGGRP